MVEFWSFAVIPVEEKLSELVVKYQLLHQCQWNNIIISNRSRFKTRHDYEAVMLDICDEWFHILEDSEIIFAVFLILNHE